MFNEIEILAPAGDKESFYSAINNGANAIYLGLKNFNARNKAENFTIENLRNFVLVAHLFNVKIYVVVNTLINNEEILNLLALVDNCIKAKVDAFIVQDIGVAKLLINTFQGIVLHSSTQMGVHSLQGAIIAQELGFKRIVLSREATLQDIKEIKQNTNLEIEYFVHGALCVSFSGNCYLSSLLNNESGNRGRCLQPCRLLYSSFSLQKEVKKGYLLSANDLCLIDEINKLKECGVTSFKIEGRLRRPSYVAYAVKSYLNANMVSGRNTSFNSVIQVQNFKKLFNRGNYNTGYYLSGEVNKQIINTSYQNHRGIKIGVVKQVKNFKDIYEILIKTNGYEINKNDGLKFIINNSEKSLGVGSVNKTNNKNEYLIYTKVKPKINSEVYLTVDSKWEESLLNTKKKILFDAEFEAHENNFAKLKLIVNNTSVVITSLNKLTKAKNCSLTIKEVEENLCKTKDTFFEFNNLNKCSLQNVFMPKSQLNELRRNALEKLQEAIINNYENNYIKPIKEDYSFYKSLTNNIYNQETNFICFNEKTPLTKIEEFFNKTTSCLVFSPSVYNLEHIKEFISKIKERFNAKKFYLNLPKVLRSEDFEIIKKIVACYKISELGIVANNIGHLYFSQLGYEVIGGVYLNITNIASVQVLKDFNVTKFVKSFESFASSLNVGLTYIGSPAVMTFCHCPYKTNFENEFCSDCKFNDSLEYLSEDKRKFKIRRTKIKNCIFELIHSTKINIEKLKLRNYFLDLLE